MVGCSAPFCSNSSAKGFLMKSFPRNPLRREQWLSNMNRNNFIPGKYSCLCEAHFTEDQFENNRKDNKRPLKYNAVPTLFRRVPIILRKNRSRMKKCSVQLFHAEKSVEKHNILEYNEGNIGTINSDLLPRTTSILSKNSSHEEYIKCRTCLVSVKKESASALKTLFDGKTLEEMLAFCIPKVAFNISKEDLSCNKCTKSIRQCYKFINNFLENEEEMKQQGDHSDCDRNSFSGPVLLAGIETVSLVDEKGHLLSIKALTDITDFEILHDEKELKIAGNPVEEAPKKSKYRPLLPKGNLPVHDASIKLENLKIQYPSKKSRNVSSKILNCNKCSSTFRFLSRLKLHKQIVHDKIKAYLCTHCGKRFGSTGTLKSHCSVAHQNHVYICHICGKKFKRLDYMRNHLQNIHKCDMQKISKDDTIEITSTDKTSFECMFCEQVFSTRKKLEAHFETHSGIRKFKCNFCGLRFTTQGNKQLHNKCHTSDPENKFVCMICWKKWKPNRS